MQGNKTLIALAAVVIVAGGAYYMLSGAPAPTAMEADTTAVAGTTEIPAATDSVDDFATAMEADLAATAAALNAFDADVTASLSEVEALADSSQLYDPENI